MVRCVNFRGFGTTLQWSKFALLTVFSCTRYTSVCDNHAITTTDLEKLSLSLWQRILSSHSLLLAFCWGLRGIQLLKNATLPAKVVKIAHAATI